MLKRLKTGIRGRGGSFPRVKCHFLDSVNSSTLSPELGLDLGGHVPRDIVGRGLLPGHLGGPDLVVPGVGTLAGEIVPQDPRPGKRRGRKTEGLRRRPPAPGAL